MAELVDLAAPTLEPLKIACYQARLPGLATFATRLQQSKLPALQSCYLSMVECVSFESLWALIVAAPVLSALPIRVQWIPNESERPTITQLLELKKLSIGIFTPGF